MTDPPNRRKNAPHSGRCSGKSKTSGEQCRNRAIPGGFTCRIHGSGTQSARDAAAARLAADEAARAVIVYGARRDIDATAALLEEVQWTAGHVAWLRARVQEIDPKALTVGVAEQRIDPAGGKTVTIRTTANIWLDLYDRERKHLLAVCAAALRAGVEDRAVRLAERQGELLAEVIRAVLGDLDLTPEQAARARTIVPTHLRAVVNPD